MSAGRSLALRAGLIVSGAFLVSRVLGYVRLVVIGNTFGASPELDAFFAAFRLPDLIFQLVAVGRSVFGSDPDRVGPVHNR